MTPGEYNFTIYLNVEFTKVLTFLDGDGVAIPLTGLVAYAQARPIPDSPDAIDLGATITDAAAGKVTMTLTQEQVLSFKESSNYAWSMVFQRDSDGQRIGPFVTGLITVEQISTHLQ